MPPCCSEREPMVPPPVLTRSVSPQTTSILSMGMPVSDEAIIDQAVDVALPMRRGAGEDGRPTVGVDLDAAVLPLLGRSARDLHVDAHADPELARIAARPALGLLAAQRGVVRCGERLVERAVVVADVVGLADDRGVRLVELGDQVGPAHIDRVHPDLRRVQVHRPLDRRGRLRPPGAPVGHDRCGVGDDRGGVALDLRDGVHARRHGTGHHGGQDGAHLGERAAVLQHVQPVGEDLAVPGAADGDALHLGPAVTEGDHGFAAGLPPEHRAAELLGEAPEQQLLRVGADLGAEAAADVRREDADLVRLRRRSPR